MPAAGSRAAQAHRRRDCTQHWSSWAGSWSKPVDQVCCLTAPKTFRRLVSWTLESASLVLRLAAEQPRRIAGVVLLGVGSLRRLLGQSSASRSVHCSIRCLHTISSFEVLRSTQMGRPMAALLPLTALRHSACSASWLTELCAYGSQGHPAAGRGQQVVAEASGGPAAAGRACGGRDRDEQSL